MRRILFVDDEPRVLDGIKRMLHPIRNKWEMVFVTSGKEALRLMANSEFDMLVTDIRMPGMSGIELLREMVARHPQVIRIILSGTADAEVTLHSATLAHQYLVKPCDAATLRGTIERGFSFGIMLEQPALKQLVSRVNTLPSLPASYGKLQRALRDPESSIKDVGKIIADDPAMTAKILQLVNSAFFGLRRHIGHPSDAVIYLGLETVKSLALTVSAFSQFGEFRNFGVEDLQRHSVAVGTLARQIAVERGFSRVEADDALTGGLLHDVGKLVLCASCPEPYRQAIEISRKQKIPQVEAEQQLLGASHALVGGYLLWLWGLPDGVIEAVVKHHGSSDEDELPGNSAIVVRFANTLLRQTDPSAFDVEAFRRAGLMEDFGRWQLLADQGLETKGTDVEKNLVC